MRESHPTARFWVYWNGTHARLSLRYDEHVELYESHRTDEGWSSTYERYDYVRFDGGDLGLACEIVTDGSDCDGRLTHSSESICPLTDLMAREPFASIDGNDQIDDRVRFPEWQVCCRNQRDYEAEKAGY